MKQLLLILLLSLVSVLASTAQQTLTFTRQLQEQKAGQGTIILIQDEEITTLVNNVPVEVPAAVTPKAKADKTAKPKGKAEEHKGSTTPAKPSTNDKTKHTPTQPARSVEARTADHPATTSTYTGRRERQKIRGYRIQVFSGSGNAQAKKAAKAVEAKIRSAFPELAVYCHFKSPRWICRVGDFATRAEAQRYLTKIRNQKLSNEASIVSDQVFVVKQ